MRLMCSQNRAEVEAVKDELLKVGIVAETRNNPVAESLGLSGVELWVQDERDFYNAAKLFAQVQAGGQSPAPDPDAKAPEVYLAVEEPQPKNDVEPAPASTEEVERQAEPQPLVLQDTRSLLEKEIEEMLQSEAELSKQCASLRGKIKELEESLGNAQAGMIREAESRIAAEKKQGAEISALQNKLERQRAQLQQVQEQLDREQAERQQLQEQLIGEKNDLQQQLNSREESLKAAQKQIDSQSEMLQKQEAAVVELKEEILAREVRRAEDEKALSKVRAQLVTEREGRLAAEQAKVAAEQRAEAAIAAQEALEKQLAEQKHLEQELQTHMASLNSLYSKVHAKRSSRA